MTLLKHFLNTFGSKFFGDWCSSRVARPTMSGRYSNVLVETLIILISLAAPQISVFWHQDHLVGGLGSVWALWRWSGLVNLFKINILSFRESSPHWEPARAKLSSQIRTLSRIQGLVLDGWYKCSSYHDYYRLNHQHFSSRGWHSRSLHPCMRQ